MVVPHLILKLLHLSLYLHLLFLQLSHLPFYFPHPFSIKFVNLFALLPSTRAYHAILVEYIALHGVDLLHSFDSRIPNLECFVKRGTDYLPSENIAEEIL